MATTATIKQKTNKNRPTSDRFTIEEAWGFIEKKGSFTTIQLATQFRASKMQAAGVIANLVRLGELEANDPAKEPDGTSRWILRGKKKKAKAARR